MASKEVKHWRPKRSREEVEAMKKQAEKMRQGKERKASMIRDWQIELNNAHREAVFSTIKPDPTRYNAEMFLIGELYGSAAMLSKKEEPEWKCPVCL